MLTMRTLLACGLALALSMVVGCASMTANPESRLTDGYQVGDVTADLLEYQATYCAEADPVKRAVALALLRSHVPDYPSSGLCSDPLSLVSKVAVSAEGGALDNVDIDQAIADQAAARQRQEAYSDESPNPE